jgi:hypothetical protein
MVHTYNPSTWEAEAGGSQVQSQPGLHSYTLFKKTGVLSNVQAVCFLPAEVGRSPTVQPFLCTCWQSTPPPHVV